MGLSHLGLWSYHIWDPGRISLGPGPYHTWAWCPIPLGTRARSHLGQCRISFGTRARSHLGPEPYLICARGLISFGRRADLIWTRDPDLIWACSPISAGPRAQYHFYVLRCVVTMPLHLSDLLEHQSGIPTVSSKYNIGNPGFGLQLLKK